MMRKDCRMCFEVLLGLLGVELLRSLCVCV